MLLVKHKQGKVLPPYTKLSQEDFAARVGLSYRTIYRYIKNGQLVPRKTLGGKVYFFYKDVDTFLNHHSDKPLVFDEVMTDGKPE